MLSKIRRSGTTGTNDRKSTVDPSHHPPPTPPNHLSATEYAARCKLILELRADLYILDTDQDLKIDFPRLVVIGDQSSGKSSLVEAVSGINVPRDSGTCTRCPMECIMRSTNDPWSCHISLQSKFDDGGRRISKTVPFGPPIYDRSSVDLWIRRAQAAILSPHRAYTDFLTKSELELAKEVDLRRLQFSNNSVRVEIKDPESPDLDFVDLPGIVHAVDPPSLEQDVIDMVASFIEPENTVILIAMPMTSDWQTQTAVRLAKDADPKGVRTIGILTKPDVLQDGDIGRRETWKKILANEESDRKTKHGYYCVRLPNDLERTGGITRDKALNIAEDFFNSHAPWNQMEDKSRCGIPNFVKNISDLLLEKIEKYLPVLAKEVNRLLDACLRDIAKLPPLLDKEPHTEILLRISSFCQAFNDAVFGRDHRDFVQGNKLRYSHFSQEIRSTQPIYTHFGEAGGPGYMGPCLSLADIRQVKEGTITWELPPHVPFDATVKLVEMYTSKWKDPSMRCFDNVVTNSIKLEKTLLSNHFGQYTKLLDFVSRLTTIERGHCRDETRKFLQKILQFESQPLFTQNEEFLSSERDKWLRDHRSYASDNTLKSVSRPKPSSPPTEHNHNQEFELMADSYAYFQVAHKRIIDYVPLTIEHELNQTFANNLRALLFSNISRESATPGRLEELIREDPSIENRRQNLETRRKELLKIKEKLDAFWSLSSAAISSGSNASRFSFGSMDYHNASAESLPLTLDYMANDVPRIGPRPSTPPSRPPSVNMWKTPVAVVPQLPQENSDPFGSAGKKKKKDYR